MKKFLIIMLALSCAFAMFSCGEEAATACQTCVDEDLNCVCDTCGNAIACVDADGDEKCDVCGAEVLAELECTEHKDENGDGKCDSCGIDILLGDCKNHYDLDKDTKCDVCAKTIECFTHYDEIADGICDRCGAAFECGVHSDKDMDKKCDRCGAAVCTGHADINKDSKCDYCGVAYDYAENYAKDAEAFIAALEAGTAKGVEVKVKIGEIESTYTTTYNEDGSYVLTRSYIVYNTDINADDVTVKTDTVKFDKDGNCIEGDATVAAQIGAKGIKANITENISNYKVDGQSLVIKVPASDSASVIGVKIPTESTLIVTIDGAGNIFSISLDYVDAKNNPVSIVCAYK